MATVLLRLEISRSVRGKLERDRYLTRKMREKKKNERKEAYGEKKKNWSSAQRSEQVNGSYGRAAR